MVRRILDSPAFYFGCAGLLLIIAIATQFELSIPSRPTGTPEDIRALRGRNDLNVIFLLVDTLRADHIGIYGYERATTPVMDDLGKHGIVFKHVISQSSWTKSSMASLWTATNPTRNGVTRFNHTLPPEAVFPAEIFQREGFRTAGIWRNGWVAPNFGFEQGFDTYVKPMTAPDRRRMNRGNPSARTLKGTDLDIIDSATEFLRNFGNERFFLYLHFMDLHQYVYDDRAPNFGQSYADFYDSSLNWTDRLIGSFLREVDDMDLLTKTVVVISSDHGEAFREHGFEGHARTLYREVAEVPFIIMLPFVLKEGVEVDATIANLDVWPTLLDMLGLPALPDVDGVSQLPLVLEAANLADAPSTEGLRRPVFSQIDRSWGSTNAAPSPLIGVSDENARVFVPLDRPANAEYYDAKADRMEQTNLAEERAEDLDAYRELVDAYIDDDTPPWGVAAGTVELEEMQLNQLKALGYKIEP